MTWLKLSDDFAEQAARSGLTDAAFRTHVEGLLWTMRRETGGWIWSRDIRRFAETHDPETAVQELVGKDWWHYPAADGRYPEEESYPGSFKIAANMDDQPEPDLIAARRRRTAERVRRHRRKLAGLHLVDSERETPGNGVTERVTRDGSGRDGSALRPKVKSITQDDDLPRRDLLAPAEGGEATPSQSRKSTEITTARNGRVTDDQQPPIEVLLQSQGADRNAREAGRCGHCGGPIDLSRLGPAQAAAARYCSPKHRTAAWHARRRAAAEDQHREDKGS